MKRVEVYVAELQPRSGSEQRGTRPVIVVSHNGFNDVPTWRSVIVVPCSTSAAQARRGPTAVPLVKGTAGLKHEGVALCHEVTTLDRSNLTKRIGVLPEADLKAVNAGLLAALDLAK